MKAPTPRADATRARWESSWLTLVARPEHGEASIASAERLARAGGAWTRLLDRFERETLIAHAARLWARLPRHGIPVDVRDALRKRRHVHHATGLVYVESLRLLLARMAQAGVRALAFKGPVLGHLLFGGPTERGYGDLDVLVPPAQRFRAGAVLAKMGYRPLQPVAPRRTSPARTHTSVAFVAPERVDVDLHWGFSSPLLRFDLPRAGLWHRTRRVELGGFSCETLGPEDTFLHTCFRGAKDDYVYWSVLADLAGLLHAGALSERKLVALAARTGARRMLHVGLLLAESIAGATLPASLAERAHADAAASVLAAAYRGRLESGAPTSQDIRARLARVWRLRERTADRIAGVVGAVARASEPRPEERWPAWTWPVQRPLRLLRDLRTDARPPLGGASP